jgi:RNA polymerase sigma-70 factor (ECF subfamily)
MSTDDKYHFAFQLVRYAERIGGSLNSLAAQLLITPTNRRLTDFDEKIAIDRIPDEQLLDRIGRGDREALGYLFRRYARIVHGIGRKILRDSPEAEDFVQDFFIYIHRKSGVYESTKGPANSWIIQTIYYQAFQRRAQLAVRKHRLPSIGGAVGHAVGSSPTVMDYDQSLEGLIGRAKLREIVDYLTEDQWETLRLHFFEGHTLSEIARARGQSVGNVRHHFYRGIEKLRSRVFLSELQDRITSGTR